MKLIAVGFVALAVLGSPLISFAADKPAEKAAQAPKQPRGLPFNGKIGAVDKTAKTITLEGKEKTRTFQITSATRIQKDKKPATLEEVLVGDHVGGYARENAEGKLEVVTLNTGIQPRAAKGKEGEKKK